VSSDVEVPFIRTTRSVGQSREASALHEEVDALHAAALLLFVERRAALAPVPLLVRTRGAALIGR
jgi:hypothetical protein